MHYIMMVVGDDVAAQLAPYDENSHYEYQPNDEEFTWYRKRAEETGESLTALLNRERFVRMSETEFKAALTDPTKVFNVYTTDDSGAVTGLYQARNPNAKWDWYKISGRWTDRFQFKDQKQRSPACAKKFYDFDAMFQTVRDEALQEWVSQHGQDGAPAEREAFLTQELSCAFPCYAILDADGWRDREHSEHENWAEYIREYINKLDDETTLTFVDYHI